MQAIKFPVPNRSEYIPSPYEPDADGVLDIGYYKGSIIGGRPYVLECWQMDELVVATVFFSDEGLDAYSREDLVLLLELEDIIKFIGGKRLFQCTHTEDDAGMRKAVTRTVRPESLRPVSRCAHPPCAQ